jgi:Dual OB-containing domain
VSGRLNEEISLDERRFEDGSEPALLDVVEIPMLEARGHSCQVENHLIAEQYYWTKVGEFPRSKLRALCESPQTLWTNGYHSYSGINDRIPETEAGSLPSSLVLIEPEQMVLCVERGLRKLQVRAEFGFRGQRYKLTVTDPDVERSFLRQGEGRHKYEPPAVACVSIGEPFEGYRYKLIASIIDL